MNEELLSDIQNKLFLSSVPLVRLNSERKPTGFASGCLIDYADKRILLTVSHVTEDQKNWAIQLRYFPSKGTETYQLGQMNFLKKASLSKPEVKDVDFSYVEVPHNLIAYRQEIDPPNLIKSEVPISVHKSSLEDVPGINDSFGFCGMVLPTQEDHLGQLFIGGELRVYSRLSFSRSEGDYYVFSLPFTHPGHEHFRGCSGAPILNSKGALIGLVCQGCEDKNEIWAISLRVYKTAIDILVGNIK